MERRFLQRKSQFKPYSKRVLILCEGETEVNYFLGLKSDEEMKRRLVSVDVDIYQPDNYSPKGLVEEAKRKIKEARSEKNIYDNVWVVFDRDQHPYLHDAFQTAKANKIRVAFSNVCFELWILLHFERMLRPEDECDNVKVHVKRNYPDYEKSGSHYERLKDKVLTAIQNGKWVIEQTKHELERGKKVFELSTYTNVHELVEFLISLSK